MTETIPRLSTGVSGLDDVLNGGYLQGDAYLIRGDPGTGKTLLGLHFLRAGVEAGEPVLFVNLEESETKIRRHARSVDFDLDGIEFLDLSPSSDTFTRSDYDVFGPEEVEQETVKEVIAERVGDLGPTRVLVDPITRLRHLFASDYQFRKNVVGFVDYLEQQGGTVLFTTQNLSSEPDDDLRYLGDGTVDLSHGVRGRSVTVPKFRGSEVQSGRHGVSIREGGMRVYPELQPETHVREFAREVISSGVPGIDSLLEGGIERGTITVLSGPTGVGKTTLGAQFMKAAAGRGERSVIYMFEEGRETFYERSESVNIPITDMVDDGRLQVEEVEALNQSAESFASQVRQEVERHDTSIVMIDGIDGYRLSLRGEEDRLTQKLHALCRYLKNMGVTVVLVDEVSQITGEFRATNAGISYLADNIVFLRHLERRGEIRKAIGVLKKRTSDYERQLRQFRITEHGIRVGESLSGLRGVLTGTPEEVAEHGRDVAERTYRGAGVGE
jgi:circadian clock protein KaiC